MTKAGIGVLIGVVIGAGVGGIGGTIASVAVSTQKRIEVRRGWNSTPSMVAKRDLAAGAVLELEDIGMRSVAESLFTTGHINPEAFSYVAKQRLRVPVKAGQPIEWSFVDVVMLDKGDASDACTAAIETKMRGSR